MAAAKPLFFALILALGASASAGVIDSGDGAELDPPKVEAAAPVAGKPAAVDAPPVLPLFAGALAVLGWRLGRRRRQ